MTESTSKIVRPAPVLFLLAAFLPLGGLFGTATDERAALDIERGMLLLRAALVLCAVFFCYLARRRDLSIPAVGDAFDRHDVRNGILLFSLGLGLHLFRLGSDLAFDEIWMWDAQVRKPLATSIARYESDNNHPLYSFAAWVTTRVFEDGAGPLRLPAAIFGAIDLYVVYRFGRRFLDRTAAVIAALLLAFSYHHIWFAQNARGYTALLFFALASSNAFFDVMTRGRRRDIVCYGVCAAAAVWSHLTGAFVVAAHVVFAVAAAIAEKSRGRLEKDAVRSTIEAFLCAGAVGFLLLSPLLLPMMRFFTTKRTYFEAKPTWKDPLWTVRAAIESFGLPMPVGFAAIALAAVVLIVGFRRAGRKGAFLSAMAILPGVLLGGVLVLLGRNLWPRMFFFLAGFWVLTATLGAMTVVRAAFDRLKIVDATRRKWFGAPLLAIILAVQLVAARKAWFSPKQDFAGAKRYIDRVKGPDDEVYACGLATFAYGFLYGPIYRDVATAEEIDRIAASRPSTLLVFVSKIHLESWNPELWAAIKRHATQLEAFPGTMGQEPVVVVRLDRSQK